MQDETPEDETPPPEPGPPEPSAPEPESLPLEPEPEPLPQAWEPPPPEPPVLPPTKPPRLRRRRRGLFGRLFFWLVVLTLVAPVSCTVIYKVVPPPVTILMVQRLPKYGFSRDWVPLREISPSLQYAAIAAEDARYCEHKGFDFEAIEKAMKNNKRGRKLRGGSTISQQTAKNVFLWPSRSYVRKGLEAYFTVLIETVWGKRRILEVYLNTVEWGPGVYGAEAASRRYFGVGADQLTTQQAARLAAILPSPLKWKAANPGPYVARRARRIAAASSVVRREGLAFCIGPAGRSRQAEPAARETRRKAAEQIMEQTAPPPLPEETADLPPPDVVDPAPIELPDPTAPAEPPPPAEEAPPPEETPAAP